PYVWLPLRFGEGTEMSLPWADSWRWEEQPYQPVHTVDVRLPDAVGLGETHRLPRTGTLHLDDGSTSTRRISWEAQLDRPGLVEVNGSLSGSEGLTVTRRVLVAPRHMVHVVNAGGEETSDYLAMREHSRGAALRNSLADQPYGPGPR